MTLKRTQRKPADSTDGKRLVLVVDDSRAQRALLARALDRWGYTTIEADSGEAALGLCHQFDVDLVISDWMMPGMSGVEFCRGAE